MDHRPKFCYVRCFFLSITESEQDKMGDKRIPHFCKKYDKQVKHSGHHPLLVRLDECDVCTWETPKFKKIDWSKKIISKDEFEKEYMVKFDEHQKIDSKIV